MLTLLAGPGWSAPGLGTAPDPPAEPRFNRDVRPVLVERCLACHGPEGSSRQAGLRLDRRESVLEERRGRRAVVPGRPEQSELVRRIESRDPASVMPPPAAGPPLTRREKSLLRRWIERGAAYEPHWSYVLPRRPELPAERRSAHPVDSFIDARLAEAGVEPVGPADRESLLRRLSFDLTGLPPEEDERARFLADASTDPVGALADRLLASPHYGERMAALWLDWVRCADTLGMHLDEPVERHPYRDYVVSAFNDNLPFDRFTLDQLAGDLLEEPTRRQRAASGYNRLNPFTTEGGVQPKDYLARYAADRVGNAGLVWLGSTFSCAQCHDHKYDPFTLEDFYAFSAFFADLEERAAYFAGDYPPQEPVPATAAEAAALDRIDAQAARLRRRLRARSAALAADQTAWESARRAAFARDAWRILWPEALASKEGTRLETLPDGSVLASGPNPDADDYVATVLPGRRPVTGLRLEALTHESLSAGALSRDGGNFALTGVAFEAIGADGSHRPLMVSSATADYEQMGRPISAALDDDPATGWSVDGRHLKADRRAVFTLAEPYRPAKGDRLRVTLSHRGKVPRHQTGRFRLAATSLPEPGASLERFSWPPRLVAALALDPSRRAPDETAGLSARHRAQAPALRSTHRSLAELERRRARLTATWAKTPVSRPTEPRMVRVLPRGNWMDESGAPVEPRGPGFLPPVPHEGRRATRLDLARWLTSRENPLTARVFVNRLWAALFGAGLVRTPDDFGSRGELPTHPELLDWLAVDFAESGYDVKRLVRLLASSAAYRRSSAAPAALRAADPDNRLLARQTAFRVEAEAVRDAALAVSGLLDRKVGGPSERLPEPLGFGDSAALVRDPAARASPERTTPRGGRRRSVYAHWKRALLHPELQAFDAPPRDAAASVRPRSETALQALALLNSPGRSEAARAFALRIRAQGPTDAERLSWAFRRALGRDPAAAESEVLAGLHAKHRRAFADDPSAAAALLGPAARGARDPADLAAWASVARALLSLHEGILRP